MPAEPTWRAIAAPCGGHADSSASGHDVRCDCGSLLARWTPNGLELKCRRCKRHVIVPIEESQQPVE